LLIAGHDTRTLISYDGQPPTCYRCNAIGHQQQDCPRRRVTREPAQNSHTSTWADIVAHSNTNRQHIMENSTITQPHKIRDERFGTDDTRKALEGTNSQTDEMYQDIISVNELDPLITVKIPIKSR